MEYEEMKLQCLSKGLLVQKPKTQKSIAIIRNLSEGYDFDYLKQIFNELKEKKIKNLILDTSKYSSTVRAQWVAFLEGALFPDFNTKYFGITKEEAGMGDQSFAEYIGPRITENLESAIESFN